MRQHLRGRRLPLATLSLCFAAAGCTAPIRDDGAEPRAEAREPIIDGSLDPDHPAVVWLLSNEGFACTGTIIAVNGTTGYVLTAAHCADMNRISITTDFQDCFGQPLGPACAGVFEVHDQIYHPGWTGDIGESSTDFSLIRFVGAGPSTPVIPAASANDGVAAGAEVDIVGFGQTELGDNSTRNHKVTQIGSVLGDLFSHPSTVCFGDSGGPAIIDGFVVGVSSFVDSDNCRGRGYSGRVQTVYEDFIRPYIEQEPIALSCNDCLGLALSTAGGPCGAEIEACAADPRCTAIQDCVDECVGNVGCEDACGRSDPAGFVVYDAIDRCAACDVCEESCGHQPLCDAPSPTVTAAATTVTSAEAVGTGAGGGDGSGSGGAAASSDDDAAADDGGCAIGPRSRPRGEAAWVALAGALLLARRRRTSPKR